ncbi:MAG: efflux RND transporter permease subunit [Gammaproteobacteria bacterium]
MVTESDTEPQGPIQRIIAFCAHHSLLTLFAVMGLALWGYRALIASPLDAIPDLSDVQVIIYTEWPGRSPDLVEDQITYPLTSRLLAAPKVRFVRGQSFMGLSFVYVVFDDDADLYWARSRVLEYLSAAEVDLPEGARPILGPDATGVGWVFEYALIDKSGQHDLAQLRSLQDFKLRYWLESVEGVAEVASVGGFRKEYQVAVDPYKLADYGIALNRIAGAIRGSNNDVSGRVLEISGHEHFIRGRGYIHSVKDIESIAIGTDQGGAPVTVGHVAKVSLGPALRRGLAELNGEGETVGGIVVMRHGEDALNVIERVKRRIEEIKKSLPPGVEIVTAYDRSSLIERAVATLGKTLIEEMLVVSLVILAFLLHFRSALIAILTLPVAVLLAFVPLSMQHLTANIMSLGGIAVAVGAMTDATITIIENIHNRLEKREDYSESQRRAAIILAMQEVGPSIFYALLIITVSFLPIFALEGTEGRLFTPLAYTKTYSMGFASLLAITLTPALAVLLIRGKIRSNKNRLSGLLIALYGPVVRFAIRYRGWVVGVSVLSLLISVPVFFRLGSEFMPPLNEGSILYMPTALPGISATEAEKVLRSMNKQLKSFPEVENVFGKIGRSTSPTDSAPLSMVETVITLKPMEEWREGRDWEGLIAEMDKKLQYPGMPNIWWMPIQTRIEMLATGIRSDLGIKIFGDNLKAIETVAVGIERALLDDERTRPYTRSAFAERLAGGYYFDIMLNRDKIARYGLTVDDVEEVIAAAAGGVTVSHVFEGRERHPVNLRYARDYRNTPEALEQIRVPTKTGAQIPLAQLADFKFTAGPPMLRSEDGELISLIFVDVKDIGIVDYVNLARQVVEEKTVLPPGMRIAWSGQFEYFERAKAKLGLLAPLTLAIVFLMLFLNRNSIGETLIILSTIPFSLIGAFWLLYLLDYNLSIAVWVGIIALAGLAAEMGVLMSLYLDMSFRQRNVENRLRTKNELADAIVEGAVRRIRPKLMTGMTTLVGLTPILWQNGTGADVMKRIAAPMVGGILSTLIMVLFVLPAVYFYLKSWKMNS